MKILIKENKLEQIVFLYIENTVKNLNMIFPRGKKNKYFQFIDKEGNLMMDGIAGTELLVDTKIWNSIKLFFSLSDEQIENMFLAWFQRKYKISFKYAVMDDIHKF